MLLRQWSYQLPCLEEHAGDDGCDGSADPERLEAEAPRHLGPVGLKGAVYRTMKELTQQRLERLRLGCSWQEVLMAAELNTAICNRAEPTASEAAPRKKSRKEGASGGAGSSCSTGAEPRAVGRRLEQLELKS